MVAERPACSRALSPFVAAAFAGSSAFLFATAAGAGQLGWMEFPSERNFLEERALPAYL